MLLREDFNLGTVLLLFKSVEFADKSMKLQNQKDKAFNLVSKLKEAKHNQAMKNVCMNLFRL